MTKFWPTRRKLKNPVINLGIIFETQLICTSYSVSKSCLTLCDPMDCNPPGFSVRGIFQARILEWFAIFFSIYTFYFLIFVPPFIMLPKIWLLSSSIIGTKRGS